MVRLRKYIRALIIESKEEVAKIMQLWDNDSWEQANELAYVMGPEISRHPDLKIWYIVDGENGNVVISDINYDQAMDPKYQAFVADPHEGIDDEPDSPYLGRKVSGASARTHPPTQEDLETRIRWVEQEGLKLKVTEVDDEYQGVSVVLEEV